MAVTSLRIQAIIEAVDRISRPITRMQDRVGRFSRAARRQMERVDRVTSRVAKTIGVGLAVAFTAAAAAAVVLGRQVDKLANDLDALGKESRRLDFPIDELQEWKFVASQSGVQNEAFSKGLQTFAKRLGEAKMGFGTLKEAIGRNDKPFLNQLKNTKNVSDAFELYLAKIREAPKATDKIALATTAFGRSGAELVNITHNSTQAIEALRREQIENGVVTERQARFAEIYVDAMDSLKRSFGGFMQTALVPLLPMATVLAKRLREWVIANREVIATKLSEWIVRIIDNFQYIVKWVKRVAIGIGIFLAFAGAVKAVIAVLTLLNVVVAANPISLIVIGIAAAIAAIAALIHWAEELVAWFESIPAQIRILLMVINPLIAALYGIAKAAAFIKANWSEISDFFINLWNGIVQATENAINYLLNNGPISWIVFAAVRLQEVWGPITGFFKGIWKGTVEVFDSAVKYLTDRGPLSWFKSAVGGTESAWEPLATFFSDLWDGIVSTFEIATGTLMGLISPITDLFKELSDIKEKAISDKIGKIELGGRIKRDLDINLKTGAEKEAEKTNSYLEDLLADVDKLKASNVVSTQDQTALLTNGMMESANKMAKIANQRFIDVSAPFQHFLRGQGGETFGASASPAPVSVGPHVTTQRFLEERSTVSKTELTLRTASGTSAEVTQGELGPSVRLLDTGAF